MTVFVRSVGAVSAAGTGIAPLLEAFSDPGWLPVTGVDGPDTRIPQVAVCREFEVKGLLPPMVARRMDRPSRLFAVAAREAIAAADGSLPLSGDRTAITAGTWNAGTAALIEILRAVFTASPDEAPPMHFPSTVANAAASQLGILEKISGPNLTFAEKQVGGLRAIGEAARMLGTGRADAALAGGVDEAQWLNAESYGRLGVLGNGLNTGMVLGEGAAVLLLSNEPGGAPLARLAGWGSASEPALPCSFPLRPDGLLRACSAALSRAAMTPRDIDFVMSLHNGIEAVSSVERHGLRALFTDHRPSALAITGRLGEGAFGGALRVATAALILAGRTLPAWPLPLHLQALGLPELGRRPSTALVTGVATGGSSLALVLTRADR